jgi:hypothetical protein
MIGLSAVGMALSDVEGTRTCTGTLRSTVVQTNTAGSVVSTNHSVPETMNVCGPPTTYPAGGSTPQTSTTGGSPQA